MTTTLHKQNRSENLNTASFAWSLQTLKFVKSSDIFKKTITHSLPLMTSLPIPSQNRFPSEFLLFWNSITDTNWEIIKL